MLKKNLTILLSSVLLYNWSESCCLGEEFVQHPGSYRSAPSKGLAAGMVLSHVGAGTGWKGIRNTYDSFFFGCWSLQQDGTSFGT